MTKSEIASLPAEDAEQLHLRDEMAHQAEYEVFQHEFAVRCGNCGHTQAVPVTIRELPEEAGR